MLVFRYIVINYIDRCPRNKLHGYSQDSEPDAGSPRSLKTKERDRLRVMATGALLLVRLR